MPARARPTARLLTATGKASLIGGALVALGLAFGLVAILQRL